jgi:hypothetical protein
LATSVGACVAPPAPTSVTTTGPEIKKVNKKQS